MYLGFECGKQKNIADDDNTLIDDDGNCDEVNEEKENFNDEHQSKRKTKNENVCSYTKLIQVSLVFLHIKE